MVVSMTEEELRYLTLCAPLEDAVDFIDTGKLREARALLQRILEQTKFQLAEIQQRENP